MILIYADESGTHDPKGVEPHSQYPIIAGFAAKKSVWDKFDISWKAVLAKYDAPYFHGRELTAARVAVLQNKPKTKELSKNPYYEGKWSFEKMELFRLALTKVAAYGNKIPIAGGIDMNVFNQFKHTFTEQDPYKYCMFHFFEIYHKETKLQWGNFKSDVSFFFDQNPKKEWRNAVFEVFGACQKKDPRMCGPYFDDKDVLAPLQAADLLAYRMRQLLEDAKNGKLKLTDLDNILLRNLWESAMIKFPHLKSRIKRFLK